MTRNPSGGSLGNSCPVLKFRFCPSTLLCRSWGRVGTTIGGTKLDEFEERHEAVRSFEFYFEDKTGNRWSQRENFQKVPGKFYPLDIDYGQEEEKFQKLELATSK